MTATTRALRSRGGTTRAMKNAIGSASTAHVTVTATAMPRVRRVMPGYGSSSSRAKLSSVGDVDGDAAERVTGEERVREQDRERPEVDDDQPAERAGQQQAQARAGVAVQPSGQPSCGRGAVRRVVAHGAGQVIRSLGTWWPRGGTAAGPCRCVSARRYSLRISVQASTQAAKSLHFTSVRPSRHSATGVVQYQTFVQ